MIVLAVCVLLGVAIVAVVVLVAFMGWAGQVPLLHRLALCAIAAGMLWAGPARFAGRPPGLGDLLFLVGVLTYVAATYARQLWAHLDALDGRADGRLGRRGPHA